MTAIAEGRLMAGLTGPVLADAYLMKRSPKAFVGSWFLGMTLPAKVFHPTVAFVAVYLGLFASVNRQPVDGSMANRIGLSLVAILAVSRRLFAVMTDQAGDHPGRVLTLRILEVHDVFMTANARKL